LHLQDKRRAARAEQDFDTEHVCKALLRCLRDTADGIAWRTLNFQRHILHELAYKQPAGYLERSNVELEVAAAASRVTDLQAHVLINDLTNFLRYGDLTIVTRDTIYLDELKSGVASAGNRRSKRQKRSIREKIDFLNTREIKRGDSIDRIVLIEAEPKSHVPELVDLIESARPCRFRACALVGGISN